MNDLPRVALTSLSLAVVFGAGCAAEDSPGANAPPTVEIDVANIAFSPETLEVDTGTEVVWVNGDDGVHHTATSGLPGDNGVPGVSEAEPPEPDGVFDGDLPEGPSRFTFTFDEPGTYAYFCRVHPAMTGAVIVR